MGVISAAFRGDLGNGGVLALRNALRFKSRAIGIRKLRQGVQVQLPPRNAISGRSNQTFCSEAQQGVNHGMSRNLHSAKSGAESTFSYRTLLKWRFESHQSALNPQPQITVPKFMPYSNTNSCNSLVVGRIIG
jgi:hypothetical protein